MLSRIFAFTLLISISAMADDCDPVVVDPNVIQDLSRVAKRMNVECPNQVDVRRLCNAVSEKLSETNQSNGTRFIHQTIIQQAACVETGDTPEIIQAKIQTFWNQYHDQLNCTQLGFSITNGHILKLAVEKNSRDFVNDAVKKWKVSLNHIDPVDQKTVLDYIESEIAKSRGSNMEPILQRYFTLFRTNGAKFKREL